MVTISCGNPFIKLTYCHAGTHFQTYKKNISFCDSIQRKLFMVINSSLFCSNMNDIQPYFSYFFLFSYQVSHTFL
jgi:hypothetical protein